MLRKNNRNPYIYWEEIAGKRIVYIYHDGIYRKNHAQITVDRAVKLVVANRPNKSSMVFNCLDVGNYESSVRTIIYEKIKEYKEDLDQLYMVADAPLIIAAAEIVSFFSSYKIHVVKSLEELETAIKNNE